MGEVNAERTGLVVLSILLSVVMEEGQEDGKPEWDQQEERKIFTSEMKETHYWQSLQKP